MPTNRYIQVILPLRLDWMPWYSTDIETITVGDRVALTFAGRHYSGVVASVSGTPDIEPERILPIDRLETGLERISPQEIELWKFIADYYMCSIGEVFKTAYPMQRIEKEQTALRVQQRRAERIQRAIDSCRRYLERDQNRLEKCLKSLQGRHKESVTASLEATEATLEKAIAEHRRKLSDFETMLSETGVPNSSERVPRPASQPSNPGPDWPEAGKLREMMAKGKTVLAVTAGQIGLWRALVREELGKGRSVLVLDSEIEGVKGLFGELSGEFGGQALLYHSAVTAGSKRSVSDKLRSGEPYLVLGTRSALLLPFKSLGLIVLLNEHDPAYKQDVTPRFLGRDLAAMLARIHSARLLLCSATPSLESLANVLAGKYLMFKDSAPIDCPPAEIIDTAAEKRKNGMVGNFSRRLMAMMSQTLERGEKVLLLRTWGDVHFLRDEVKPLFSEENVTCLGDEDYNAEAQIVLGTMSQAKTLPLSSIGLVAVMLCDDLFARTDFRADERALQILRQLQLRRSKESPAVIEPVEMTGQKVSLPNSAPRRSVIIQTSRSSHPVYQMLSGRRAFSYDEVVKSLLQERRDLGFPPYKRIVDVLVRDTSASRLHLMASRLAATLQKLCNESKLQMATVVPTNSTSANSIIITEPFNAAPWETDLLRIRIVLPRGSGTAATKRAICEAVTAFEKQNSYPSRIHFDVDPV